MSGYNIAMEADGFEAGQCFAVRHFCGHEDCDTCPPAVVEAIYDFMDLMDEADEADIVATSARKSSVRDAEERAAEATSEAYVGAERIGIEVAKLGRQAFAVLSPIMEVDFELGGALGTDHTYFDRFYEAAENVLPDDGPDMDAVPIPLGGAVYFLVEDRPLPLGTPRPVKIGFTKNGAARLKQYSPKLPFSLIVVLAIPGEAALERSIHAQFATLRLEGEWFRLEGDLAEFVERERKERGQ